VSNSAFNFQDLLQLVELIKSSAQFSEFKLRANGIELELRRGPAGSAAAPAAPAPVVAAPAPAPAPAPAAAPVPPPAAALSVERAAAPALVEGQAVTAPMVGTVYLAPEPGAAPFVSVGQRVEADTPVCIVEVMKLMNMIPAGRAGVVRQILVGDAQAVEFGQPLFVISAD
jgi:acetyl-CoA carboxylase biotin carboxyl carrier protein